MSNNPDVQMSPKEDHDHLAKLFNGYTAFVTALLFATIAKSAEYPRAWVVITLLASSLPSLVAWVRLDYHVCVNQGRKASGFRGLALLLGLLPSLLGITILIGHFSITGGALFLVLTVFWTACVFGVAVAGTKHPQSTV